VDLVVYDDDEKRYVPWAVALAALLVVTLVTAGLTFLLARQASGSEDSQAVGGVSSPEPATAPSATAPPATAPSAAAPAAPTSAPPAAAATPAPACTAALLRADAALERSVALDAALGQHTEIMDELLAERIDAQEALDRALPVLTDAATERRRFQQELSAYSDSRQDCPA
jgi:hypothetical protein